VGSDKKKKGKGMEVCRSYSTSISLNLKHVVKKGGMNLRAKRHKMQITTPRQILMCAKSRRKERGRGRWEKVGGKSSGVAWNKKEKGKGEEMGPRSPPPLRRG